MVDPQKAQESVPAEQKARKSKSLVTWLAISVVGMMVIYLLFNIALTSS